MATLIRKPPCTRCGGLVFRDLNGEAACIVCGRSPDVIVTLDIPHPRDPGIVGGWRERKKRSPLFNGERLA